MWDKRSYVLYYPSDLNDIISTQFDNEIQAAAFKEDMIGSYDNDLYLFNRMLKVLNQKTLLSDSDIYSWYRPARIYS